MEHSENKYAKAIEARRRRSRADLEQFEAELYEREKSIKKREDDFPEKFEVACEAIIAMVKDSKRGKVVPWAKFSQAALNLEHAKGFRSRVSSEIITLLKSERIMDLEERKETPSKPAPK